MTKIDKWILAFAGTFLLNFVGFFFYLYDVLGSRFDDVNRLAHEHGNQAGFLFLFMLLLLFGLVYNDKKGGRNSYILHNILLVIIPIVALLGHVLIVIKAIEVYQLMG